MKYIDKTQLVTIVLAGVALFFLQKYFTKKFTKTTGETVSMVGHDAVGHI